MSVTALSFHASTHFHTETLSLNLYDKNHDFGNVKSVLGMISVQVPTSLCMQNKLIIHSRYCFVEQSVYPREPNIYMGNLYLRDE